MRIIRAEFDGANVENLGLKPIRLERLGQVVALVGRNGCGKTRLLDLLTNRYAESITFDKAIKGWVVGTDLPYEKSMAAFKMIETDPALLKDLLLTARGGNATNNPQRLEVMYKKLTDIGVSRSDINNLIEAIRNFPHQFKTLFPTLVRKIDYSTIKALTSTSSNSFEKLVENAATNVSENEVESLSVSALTYLKRLPNDLVEADVNLKGLRETVGKHGQVWIATHSINILSHLSPDEIFMMKEGAIISPSRTVPGNTLRELMGLDEHIDKLKDFINSINDWAYVNFITQCFEEPAVIQSAHENDPQIEAFRAFLSTLNNGIALLDFGAGKGRLITELRKDISKEKLIEIIALEPNSDHHNLLINAGADKVFKTLSQIPLGSVDVVVMCNVLHEIEIDSWVVVCNSIKEILKNDGFLLIIEDKQLPNGEKIGLTGFHILDQKSIQILFGLPEKPASILPSDPRYQDRLMCCPIPRKDMGQVTIETLRDALLSLKESIFANIKKTRTMLTKDVSNVAAGRLAAFYAQHYINTILALEHLDNMTSSK